MTSKLIDESRSRPRGTEGSRLDRMEGILTPLNGLGLVTTVNNVAHHASGLLAYFARNTTLVKNYESGNKAKGLASKISRKKTGLAGEMVTPTMMALLQELTKPFPED